MIDLLPTVVFLLVAVLFLHRNDLRPVVQGYLLIVVSYLNVFPALDFLLSSGADLEIGGFARFQMYIITFFEIPLLFFLNRTDRGLHQSTTSPRDHSKNLQLSLILAFFLCLLLLSFWLVSLKNDLFFVRMGYQGVQDTPPDTSLLLLYLYRSAVDTSFFVILFLFYTLRATAKAVRYRGIYKALLTGYLLTFLPFFIVNSRAHLIVLILILLSTQARPDIFSIQRLKVAVLGVAVLGLIIVHTLLREFFEQNERIATSDIAALMSTVVSLIVRRLDSLVMLNSLTNTDFNPFGFQWAGLMYVVNFNIAFFTDPQAYAVIKASEVTSASVEIINRLLSVSMVDFPKSNVLDVFLVFGVYGLLLLSIFLGRTISLIQRHTLRGPNFSPSFLVAIYTLTLLFQFDKEFMGFIIFFLKWTPILLLIIYLRPRETGVAKSQLLPHPSRSVATERIERRSIVDV